MTWRVEVQHTDWACNAPACTQLPVLFRLFRLGADIACVLQVIDLIVAHGGDVMKFAGDSMIVAFAPTEGEQHESSDRGRKQAALRSVRCASQLTADYGEPGTQCVHHFR